MILSAVLITRPIETTEKLTELRKHGSPRHLMNYSKFAHSYKIQTKFAHNPVWEVIETVNTFSSVNY
jgi:hypothetical protein